MTLAASIILRKQIIVYRKGPMLKLYPVVAAILDFPSVPE